MNKEIITVKGTREGLVFYFNTMDAGFKEIQETLEGKFRSSNGFFANAKFIISPENELTDAEISVIEDICTRNGMIKSQGKRILTMGSANPNLVSHLDTTEYYQTVCNAVLFPRNFRSGQKIHVTGHTVILGDVNPGAEIIATGSIIIMGTFRGVAHAGSQGDRTSFIIAYRMQPVQIGIADKLRRSPENVSIQDYPEIALIIEDDIVIKPYQLTKRKAVNM